MGKLSICRICLSDDIPMRSIVRTPLQDVYESLTTMPFVTEDRPVVVCTLCRARLENSLELKEKCLQSEKLFAELLQSNVVSGSSSDLIDVVRTEYFVKIEPDDNVEAPDSKDNISLAEVQEDPSDVTGNDAAGEPASSSERDEPLSVVKEEPANFDTGDAAVEQDGADPYHSALGLHTECDIPMDIVKKEPDADTGLTIELGTHLDLTSFVVEVNNQDAPRLAAQKYRNDTLLNNLKRTDQTIDRVEERKRETRRDIEDTPVEKNKRVATGDDIDIRLHHEPSSRHRRRRTHTGEKPYQCNVCKKWFSQKGNLDQHVRTHTGEKPYQCNVCQKCFSKKYHLDCHILTHTGEKPYECVVCKKCYNYKGHLNVHMRTHTGEKPYECNVCKKCFSRKSCVNKHLRTHTSKKL